MARGTRKRFSNAARRWRVFDSLGGRLRVFSMALSNQMIRQGRTVKLQISEIDTPLASTTPISAPIFIFMKQSISRLTIVVKALLRIDAAACETAFSIAATGVRPKAFSCRKRFIRIMQ